jgi:hypothetical protein
MQADHQDAILHRLVNQEQLNSLDLQKELGLTSEELYKELVSLLALNYIQLENQKVLRIVLTKEGEAYA